MNKDVDHFFTSDKAVVDLYRDHVRDVTTMRVSAETGKIAPSGFEETMTFEIEAKNYQVWVGQGLPTLVARDNLDPVDAVDDIEDEDDRFLAENIYRFIKDNPIQKVNGHALTELVRSLGWVPGEDVDALKTENEDLHRQVENHRQAIEEMSAQFVAEPPPPITEDDPEWDDRDDLDKYIDTPSIYEEILDDLLDDAEPDDDHDVVIHKSMSGASWTEKIPRTRPAFDFDDSILTELEKKVAEHERRVEEMVTREERKLARRKQMLKENKPWWQKI